MQVRTNRNDIDQILNMIHDRVQNPLVVQPPPPAAAAAGPLLFTKEPPKLPKIDKGKGHIDVLARTSSAIQLWHPQAWQLMTDHAENFTWNNGNWIFMIDNIY